MTQSLAISNWSLFRYGLLAIPLAFAGLPLYVHAPDFYATEAGLSLSLIGTIILAVRVFDAVQDPVIGYLGYKYANRRKGVFIAAFAILAAGFLMLFHPVQTGAAIWFAVSLVLATTAFSMIMINMNAVGSLWSRHHHDKTRITTWREGLGLSGLLLAALLPAFVSLSVYSYILLAVLAVCGTVFIRWLVQHKDTIAQQEQARPAKVSDIRVKRHTLAFYMIYGMSMLASSIPAVLVLFYIRDYLYAEEWTGLFLALYFLSGVVAMPMWQYLSRRFGKVTSWALAMVGAVAVFGWAFTLQAGDLCQYALICIFSGMALGAELALPPSILSDIIDDEQAGQKTPVYFAALTFLTKTAFALGSAIAFLWLGQTTFTPDSANTEPALKSLAFVYALLPCVIKLFSVAGLLIWGRYYSNGGLKNENEMATGSIDRRRDYDVR